MVTLRRNPRGGTLSLAFKDRCHLSNALDSNRLSIMGWSHEGRRPGTWLYVPPNVNRIHFQFHLFYDAIFAAKVPIPHNLKKLRLGYFCARFEI